MLPATGSFRDIDCPFYENNCCDRPYCHFKHNRKDRSKERETLILKELVAKSVKQLLTGDVRINEGFFVNLDAKPDIDSKSDAIGNISFLTNYDSSDPKPNNQIPDYQPTPILELSKHDGIKIETITSHLTSSENMKEKLQRHIPVPYTPLQPDKYKRRGSLFSSLLQNETYSPTADSNSTKTYYPTPISDTNNLVPNYEPLYEHLNYTEYYPEATKSTDSLPNYNPTPKDSNNVPSVVKEELDLNSLEEEFDLIQNIIDSESKQHMQIEPKTEKKSLHGREKSKESSKPKISKHVNKTESSSSSKSKKKLSSRTKKSKRELKETDKQHHKRSSDKGRSKSDAKTSSKSKHSSRDRKSSKQSNNTLKQHKNDCTGGNNQNDSSHIDDDSDDSCMKECFRIFSNYSPPPEAKSNAKSAECLLREKLTNANKCELSSLSKKRVAYAKAEEVVQRPTVEKKMPRPGLAMIARIENVKKTQPRSPEHEDIGNNKKKRISHCSTMNTMAESSSNTRVLFKNHATSVRPKMKAVSNVQNLLAAKVKLQNLSQPLFKTPASTDPNLTKIMALRKSAAETGSSSGTMCTTGAKGARRVAHIPDPTPTIDYPKLLNPENSTIALNIRYPYYNRMVEACLKMKGLTKEEAFTHAQQEEWTCVTKCKTLNVYKQSAALTVARLNRENDNPNNATSSISQVDSILNNEQEFYNYVKKFCLTKDQLEENNYPLESGVKGKAIFKNLKVEPILPSNMRKCVRCGKTYKTSADGYAMYQEDCSYHALKKRTIRGQSYYLCCKSATEMGCSISSTHVSNGQISTIVEGYQTTMNANGKNDQRSYKIFALDCEMVYTTRGLDLARLTITNISNNIVYDQCIKPFNPIIDYNTKFSGLTSKDFENCSTSLLQAQATILAMCNSDTILVGHSLESDLKATKIIHSKIIDTAVLFPHKYGFPNKVALRQLASEKLRKIIQDSEHGHDSAEDASTCMELLKWKVREEFKLK